MKQYITSKKEVLKRTGDVRRTRNCNISVAITLVVPITYHFFTVKFRKKSGVLWNCHYARK